jgi:hypothetical protein
MAGLGRRCRFHGRLRATRITRRPRIRRPATTEQPAADTATPTARMEARVAAIQRAQAITRAARMARRPPIRRSAPMPQRPQLPIGATDQRPRIRLAAMARLRRTPGGAAVRTLLRTLPAAEVAASTVEAAAVTAAAVAEATAAAAAADIGRSTTRKRTTWAARNGCPVCVWTAGS